MSVLVTGCAGFIGSYVCRLLLGEGQPVEGVDELNDSYDVRLEALAPGAAEVSPWLPLPQTGHLGLPCVALGVRL